MRIKRVECDQFAGVQDKELQFEKGMNIVVGDNECGKSTMIDLIYLMLFKSAKLDGRSDGEFIKKYFPQKVSGVQGDIIDGVLVFETAKGAYKLKKEWGKDEATCRLTMPDGTLIRNASVIEATLKEELGFREGVYNEIVFASQKRNPIVIESIMQALDRRKQDSLSDTREDLSSTLTKAVLETGGISLDKVEKELTNRLNTLSGKWDFAADAPEGGPKRASYTNAWKAGIGEIASVYYEMDEVRSKQADAENTERIIEREKSEIHGLQNQKKSYEDKKTAFLKYRGTLDQITALTNTIRVQTARMKDQELALEKWPVALKNIDTAKQLQTKQKQAAIRSLYTRAEKAYADYSMALEEVKKLTEVDDADIKNTRSLLQAKQREESKLSGMNLAAKVKKLGDANIRITTVATGEEVPIENAELKITEAVMITIPGVMEMQLMPEGVDVEAVQAKITELEKTVKDIYEKYGVKSLEELSSLKDEYDVKKQTCEKRKYEFEKSLSGNDWEKVKAENASVPGDVEDEKEVQQQVSSLCGSKSIDAYIGGLEAQLSDFENKFGSMDRLREMLQKDKEENEANQKKIDSMDEIPEEYQGITDADQYENALTKKIENAEADIKAHDEKLREAERKLGEKSAEEYLDESQVKEARLLELKNQYTHWLNIYHAYSRLREENAGNPVEDIERKFNEYLRIITEGELKLESMDERMSVRLSSGLHALSYDILSEGTKDTISLAFRLAMLEHLYPDGDGLAVFDDPFTDMDPTRVMQSCKLIQKFAENNQVIFITCDEKYKSLLSGNVIAVSR